MRNPENVLNSLQEHSAQSGYVYDSIQLNPAMSMTDCTAICSTGNFSYRRIKISMPVRET